jgi:diguanylate cyclase
MSLTILVIESSEPCFQQLKDTVKSSAQQNTIELNRLQKFDQKKLKQMTFDAILLSENYLNTMGEVYLNRLVQLNLTQPILYLMQTSSPRREQNMIALGIEDCLLSDELTIDSLTRACQYAIARRKKSIGILSGHDQLTGLANRYLFYEHVERSISLAKRTQVELAVLSVDINKFKLINESLGHRMADLLLIKIAKVLSQSVRETDIVARFGNNDFSILLDDTGSTRDIAVIAEKIQTAMSQVFELNQHELFITCSIGVASYPESGTAAETLLANAQAALNKAKRLGRNRYYFYSGEFNKQVKLRLELEKNLRRALINSEFHVYLQPQICATSQRITGAEALLRWQHPKYGLIGPDVFIPLLEELGLLPGVEAWVLQQVCQIAKTLTDRHGVMNFSVNISGAHFKTGNLKENIFLALQSSELDGRYLEIELTENIMIEHVEHNNNLLNDLRSLGVSVALDDFGKGYSSLSYLKNFPADILKLDKAFIDNINSDVRDASIVEAMINLSHKLAIKVVAEGVETQAQLQQLQAFNCDFVQGYYFAKPMPLEEFTEFVSAAYQLNISSTLAAKKRTNRY